MSEESRNKPQVKNGGVDLRATIDRKDLFAVIRSRIGTAHGAQRAFARKHGICEVRLSKAMNSLNEFPDDVLAAVGVRRVNVFYDLRGEK